VVAADRRDATRSREGRFSFDARPASAGAGADAIAVDAIVPPRRANCGVDVIARNVDKQSLLRNALSRKKCGI
jgi:hypothetical protein